MIMNNLNGQLLTILPWVLAVLVPAGIVLLFVRQLNIVRQEADTAKEHANRSETENQVFGEKLANTQENLERERQEAQQRFKQIDEERNELKGSCKILQEENTTLQADLAAAQAKLPQLDTLKTEFEELQNKHDTLWSEKSALDANLASLKAQVEEERKAALDKVQLLEKAEARLSEELADLLSKHEVLRKDKSALDANMASLTTQAEEERKNAREKILLLEKAEDRLGKEFENLANRIFDEKHQKFNEASKTSVETLLNPMREQLKDFRKRVDEFYDQENKERASLRTEIHLLKTLNERISVDALNLTKALKGESKTRGNWGEMQLERLLEDSGLVKGREYEVQASLKSEEGKRLQPDVVVHLPEKKDVIIDSKVSLIAYDQYCKCEDEEERNRILRLHIAALRNHFKNLSFKNYDELIGVNSLDLVIMFVPIEPALLLAFEHEANLFNEAFGIGVLLVCPSTLMATLKIIHNIWRYEYQNLNALEIATEAGRLHDQFVLFVEALEDVGRQIGKADQSYQTAHKRLTSGRGNLIGRTKKLEALGAKTKKKIDVALLEAAAESDDQLETALLLDEQETEVATA